MEKQYYRTFVAIPVRPGPGLLVLRNELMASLRGERISWVQPELFHVTLRFIGETPVSMLEEIRASLRTRIQLPEATELKLEGVGSFGPRKKPRVVWAGFREPDLFKVLQQEVNRALLACGVEQEEAPYRPHLTLGRVRRLNNPETYYERIRSFSPRLQDTVCIDRMIYYRSDLGKEGPRYGALEVYAFS
jgi:2'-5' RNA ligase